MPITRSASTASAGGVLLVAAAAALTLALTGSLTVAVAAGAVIAAVGLIAVALLSRRRRPVAETADEGPRDPSRRRFLALSAAAAVPFVLAGAGLGRLVRRLTKPDPGPTIERMAGDLGAEYLELVRRGFHAETSGDLQLLLAPGNTSNYPQESTSLVFHDPRSSHASVWMYLERVPILVYAPGILGGPAVSEDAVTLADLAPTTATLMGFDGFHAPEGRTLPGVRTPTEPPKVVVTFVIDGGGWNVLEQWPDAWPNLKALMHRSLLFTNALHGSFPAVTATAHATIGTGAFPRTHGVSGHNLRDGNRVRKAYGTLGQADPSDIKVPTLADLWSEHTGGRAFIGEFGYQIWHLGMIGRGGDMPLGDKPVAVYWDEPGYRWAPQNPDLYRLPKRMPPDARFRAEFAAWKAAHPQDFPPNQPDMVDRQTPACSPPIIRYQGDVIEAAFASEDIGNHAATDLVYINYKQPDYTGHIYNMLRPQEEVALRAVDEQLRRLVEMLEARFGPGGFALIVCADHGQCPLVEAVDGVRLDPIQVTADIEARFGNRSVYPLVRYIAPSEIFLDPRALLDSGYSAADIAAWFADYTYGDNYHLYAGVPRNAIEWNRLDRKLFSAVLPNSFIERLQRERSLEAYGATRYADADPTGIPRAPL
jgi:predicted AlkP superfamily pyrophosphatase or phosphodiesterase